MIDKRNLIALVYPILWLKNIALPKIGISSTYQLRILIYHDIPLGMEAHFKEQIVRLSRDWKILTPLEFEEIIAGKIQIQRHSLLLTFDDGFHSARRVSEECLNPLNIKAIFFVIKNFIELTQTEEIEIFIKKNLFPSHDLKHIPDSMKNMDEDDIRFLLESGHTLGAHTASHARLSNLAESSLMDEIVASADALELKFRCRLDHFAYTFGDINSFSPQALEVAINRFSFVHTGLSGNNIASSFNRLLFRDAIFPEDSHYLVSAILFGGGDWYFKRSISRMYSWLKGSK
jgi:peptidoglycan/xylan/chitin deacetylase (PgdA/CDA1 family)